jgi:hypothetical protein
MLPPSMQQNAELTLALLQEQGLKAETNECCKILQVDSNERSLKLSLK